MGTFNFKDKKLAYLIFSQWEGKLTKELKNRKFTDKIAKGVLTKNEKTIFILGSLQMIKTLKASVEPEDTFEEK